jgi:16S rRNA (cytosine967-C5)-methyltransferase
MSEQVYAGAPLSRQLELCAGCVLAVKSGRSLTDALAVVPAEARPGVQALSFHVLRWLGAAEALCEALAARKPAPQLQALLVSSLALLWPASAPPYPEHTLVDQAVAAARRAGRAGAGFVNAVLRRFLRERAVWVEAVQRDERARWNHQPWWIARLRRDWPDRAEDVLLAAQYRPPMFLRVNARRLSAARYVERLAAAGRSAHAAPAGSAWDQLVVLDQPCPVTELPGFDAGDVSVQDASAQLAAPCLLGAGGLPSGARVLDACAAPGGKTAHLLELADLDLLALDQDAARLERVSQTLCRLRLRAEVACGDAMQPGVWWDGRPFDAILLDAPCSASGIVRRHPDVRWLRKAADIAALARTQSRMLEALWPLLKPGGRLLFATCSVFKAEGELQTDAFLQRLPEGSAQLDALSPGHLLPLPENPGSAPSATGLPSGDGFFYALLVKH